LNEPATGPYGPARRETEVLEMTSDEIQVKQKQEAKDVAPTRPGRTFVPDVDIYEDDEALWLWVDVPGAVQKDVSVALEQGILSVEAKVSLDDYKGLTPLSTEYNVGPYARRFSLPRAQRYDAQKIAARLVDGVLEIKVPRALEAKPRRIEVTVN
jgi:HSP20 family protein